LSKKKGIMTLRARLWGGGVKKDLFTKSETTGGGVSHTGSDKSKKERAGAKNIRCIVNVLRSRGKKAGPSGKETWGDTAEGK